jgi:formate/nitrite transporter FocA (FNT family)
MSGGATASAAAPPSELKPPAAIYEGAVAAGAAKAAAPFDKIFKLGILAGCHIAFGAYLAISVGAACPGIASHLTLRLRKITLWCIWLTVWTNYDSDLRRGIVHRQHSSGDCGARGGQNDQKDLAKNWIASYFGNVLGSLLLAYLAFKSGTLGNGPAAAAIATAKCSMAWDVAFVRGILCNWLVCMAVYMASGCSSMIGKMTAVSVTDFGFQLRYGFWKPLSIANTVYNSSFGMLRGAGAHSDRCSRKIFILLTLVGNIVGGALCVMAPFGTTYGGWFKKKD